MESDAPRYKINEASYAVMPVTATFVAGELELILSGMCLACAPRVSNGQ